MPPQSNLVERLRRLAALAPKGSVAFLAVGVVGLAVDMAVFTALHAAGLDKAVARAISLSVATVVTWLLNRRVTFAATGRARHREAGRYMIVTAFAQGISFISFLAICSAFPRLAPQIALFVGAVIATLFSYSGQRFFTFAPPRDA